MGDNEIKKFINNLKFSILENSEGKEHVEYLLLSRNLKNINRMQAYGMVRYSVAEHTLNCLFLADFIFGKYLTPENHLKLKHFLQYHDLAETLTTDIPYEIGKGFPELKNIENLIKDHMRIYLTGEKLSTLEESTVGNEIYYIDILELLITILTSSTLSNNEKIKMSAKCTDILSNIPVNEDAKTEGSKLILELKKEFHFYN